MKKLLALVAVVMLAMSFMAPAMAGDNTKVMFDFEAGVNGGVANGWDGGENIICTQAATTDYIGSGALKMHTDDVIGLADTWSGFDFPVNPADFEGYTGICFRLDARSLTQFEKPDDQMTQILLMLVKPGSALSIWKNVRFIDMYGQDVTPTGEDSDGNPKRTEIAGTANCFLPYNFDGWVFTDIAAQEYTDLAERTTMTVGLSDWCFDAKIDTSAKDVYVDQFALYKGTDYKAIIVELGGTVLAPPTATPAPATDAPTATADKGDGAFPWLYVSIGAAVVVVLAVVIILVTRKKKV